VAWYERANARSDYARRVLEAIGDVLTECRSALDVGAGFGALALPLARRLERVTALEPAPAMAAALRRAVARAGLDNVSVIEARWGAASVAPHHVVVCARVGPLLGPGSLFPAEAERLARRAVVLVGDAPGGGDKFFYGELYPLLLGRPYRRSCTEDATLGAVRGLGIVPTTVTIEYEAGQPFDTLGEACEFWMTHMGLTGHAPRAFLRAFLARRLRREDDGWFAPFRQRATVMWWRAGNAPPPGTGSTAAAPAVAGCARRGEPA
jgi:SAM-dependent methyltransferase